MENKLEKKESTEQDVRYFERGKHFGTSLDEIEKIPQYTNIDFVEMTHDQLRKFFMATDKEKFEMAYWAQRSHEKKSGMIGFVIGTIVTIILILIIYFFI